MQATAQTALECADEAVDRLLEAGRAPGDILVLTTGEAHPWQQHEVSFGEDRYWAQLEEGGDVFYAEARAARQARREVVVIAANGAPEQTAKVLSGALGRARSLVVACGDTVQLRALVDGVRQPAHA
ncbi:hypothetical protein [Streptacidiphilus sp. ASG 303]|uniref:hypothetical protein n=1 Tax=Streptomycetaceae TaxID=2062 RepID=UPI0027E1CAFF|nr:hypothetical protein [Streptacidiphilus sp. ASG 303]